VKEDKIHTTNYTSTFIEVAEDCPVSNAEVPPTKGDKPTIASMQYEKLKREPYKFTSDEVLFGIHCERKGLSGVQMEAERKAWFSKGQACLRSSPLAKRYGWGIHHDEKGRVALVPLGSAVYEKFLEDPKVRKYKAMRSKRG
jgi:hypothetical protein